MNQTVIQAQYTNLIIVSYMEAENYVVILIVRKVHKAKQINV